MNYFQKKKLAFMSIVNSVKGFIRTITGVFPLTLTNCVDEESITDYTIHGNSVQNGTPTPDTPVDVECVGEKTKNLFDIDSYGEYKDSQGYEYIDISNLEIGTKYTISSNDKLVFKINTGVGSSVNANGGTQATRVTNFTFTFTETYKSIGRLYIMTSKTWVSETKENLMSQNIQLTESDTVLPYEPYGYKIPITVSGSNLTNPKSWVSATYANGVNVNTSNYITSVGENYIEADLPTWKGIASEEFDVSEVSVIGFKINKNSIVDDYETYQCVLTEWNEFGEKLGYKLLRGTGIADTEQVFRKGIDFNHIIGAKYCRFGVVSRANAINNLRIYDFFITKDNTATDYEPYHEPITTNIYLDEPLGEGQSINYKKDGLPTIPTFKGTSILNADTTIQPSNAEITYYSTLKG